MFILPELLRNDAHSATYLAMKYGQAGEMWLHKRHARRALVAYGLLSLLRNAKPLHRSNWGTYHVEGTRQKSGKHVSLPGGYASLRNLVRMREFLFYSYAGGLNVHVSAKVETLPDGSKVQWLLATGYK